MFEPGTSETSCPMTFAIYVFPCRLEIAAQMNLYFGLFTALINAVCELLGVIPNKSKYESIGNLINPLLQSP